jgi:PAS domain-containing protein
MRSLYKHDFQAATKQAGNESAFDSELRILRDVLKLLPTGLTVQDERGDYLLVNDAAAAMLQMAAAAPAASQLTDRRETCLELLHSGRTAVLEEAVISSAADPGRESQFAALEFRRYHRTEGVRGYAVPLGLL